MVVPTVTIASFLMYATSIVAAVLTLVSNAREPLKRDSQNKKYSLQVPQNCYFVINFVIKCCYLPKTFSTWSKLVFIYICENVFIFLCIYVYFLVIFVKTTTIICTPHAVWDRVTGPDLPRTVQAVVLNYSIELFCLNSAKTMELPNLTYLPYPRSALFSHDHRSTYALRGRNTSVVNNCRATYGSGLLNVPDAGATVLSLPVAEGTTHFSEGRVSNANDALSKTCKLHSFAEVRKLSKQLSAKNGSYEKTYCKLSSCIDTWRSELQFDKNKSFILDGVEFGFNVLEGKKPDFTSIMENYKSATLLYRGKAESQIVKELELGNYFLCPSRPKVTSSLGAIPKQNGSIRLIHDLSRPAGGVNKFIESSSCSYNTVDMATKLMKPSCFLSKVDLKAAYRSVPIHPDNYDYMGISWSFQTHTKSKRVFMVDSKLPFGCKKSCQVFQALSDAVARMLERRNVTVINYLDDILIISDTKQQNWLDLDTTINLLVSLGFDINWEKVSPPSQCVNFLGVQIDSVDRTLTLPPDKLSNLKQLITKWQVKKRASKKEILSLAGKLNWACRVVRGGRTFLRRVIDISAKLKANHHRTWLNLEFRKDLEWWSVGLSKFHGFTHFVDDIPPPTQDLKTDACLVGGAGIFNSDWFYVNFKVDCPDYQDAHINCLELLTVLIAARRWGHLWRQKHMRVWSDNSATVSAVNKGTSRSPLFMSCLRELFWLSIKHDFLLTACHIRGEDNVLADMVSRLHSPFYAKKFINWMSPIRNKLNCTAHLSFSTFLHLQGLTQISI